MAAARRCVGTKLGERTIILHIHTPYVVIFKSPATEREQLGKNTYVSGKCQFPVERTIILRIHTPYVVIFKSPATEGEQFGENSYVSGK